MTPDREAWRHPAFRRAEGEPGGGGAQCHAVPTEQGLAWAAKWEREYRTRWEHRPGAKGLFPVPDAAAPKPKRDEVRFFLIIARRPAP